MAVQVACKMGRNICRFGSGGLIEGDGWSERARVLIQDRNVDVSTVAGPDAVASNSSQYFNAPKSCLPRPLAPLDPVEERSQLYNAEKTKS